MPVDTSDCGSRSTTRVRTPRAKAADAIPRVTVVLPTPPLRELTERTCTNRYVTFTSRAIPKRSLCGFRSERLACSRRSWLPIVVRSQFARSVPPSKSVRRRSRSTRSRTANSLHRLKADEAYQIGEPGHPVRAYLDVERDHPCREGVRRRRHLPRLRLPLGEPRARTGGRRGRHRVHRPAQARARDGRQQGHRERARDRRRSAGAEVDASVARHRAARRPSRRDRIPDLREGRRGRWRARHAPRRLEGHPAILPRRGHARGRQRLRRSHDVPRAGRAAAPPHRGAGARRRIRRDGAPLRARLLGAASSPEGDRDRTGAEPLRRCAHGPVSRRDRVRALDRLRERRHGRVPARHGRRTRRPARVHRDEPPHPGRAHRDRRGHRRRPRGVADAHRRGGVPRRARAHRKTPSGFAVPPCSAASRPKTPRPASAPTPARSRRTARPAARASASTAAPSTPARRSARTSTPCSRSSPAAAATTRQRSRVPSAPSPSSASEVSPPTSPSSRACSTTRHSSPATSAPRSSTSARSCCAVECRRTAAPRSSTGSPTSP